MPTYTAQYETGPTLGLDAETVCDAWDKAKALNPDRKLIRVADTSHLHGSAESKPKASNATFYIHTAITFISGAMFGIGLWLTLN